MINAELFKKHEQLARETYEAKVRDMYDQAIKEITTFVNTNLAKVSMDGLEFGLKEAISDITRLLVFEGIATNPESPLHSEWKKFRDDHHAAGLLIDVSTRPAGGRVKIKTVKAV